MLQVQDLQLFMQIVHTGNISKAAAQFQLTPAAASAALKRLEQHLQSQLLVRSTRSLRCRRAVFIALSKCTHGTCAGRARIGDEPSASWWRIAFVCAK